MAGPAEPPRLLVEDQPGSGTTTAVAADRPFRGPAHSGGPVPLALQYRVGVAPLRGVAARLEGALGSR